MKNILCVSQREICVEDFLIRVERIVKAQPFAFILREKDLSLEDYRKLAEHVLPLCRRYDVPLFLNGHVELAKEMEVGVQIPFALYEELEDIDIPLGISIHSVSEATKIVHDPRSFTVHHVIAGHIFQTACKEGLEPRGLEFLSDVAMTLASKNIPLYGIGGMRPEYMPLVKMSGASGAAVMSSLMTCDNVEQLMQDFSL